MNDKRPTEKKNWEKPELTVLVRSKPEEAVLTGCKTPGSAGPGGQCRPGSGGCEAQASS